MAQLHLILFGDAAGELWGAAVSAGSGALVVADGSGERASADLPPGAWSSDGAGWRVRADGVDLHIVPSGEGPPSRDGDGSQPIAGVQELCRVRGSVTLGESERTVDVIGTRAQVDGLDAGALESLRAVAGWTRAEEAFTLLALRAPGAKGHEADLVAATIFDADGWIPVSDPRLSTTYDGAGHPLRISLELWVGDEEHEYPRRAAGEVAGAGVTGTIGHPEVAGELGAARLEVLPLHSHSRGEDGAGVLALLTVGS